MPSKTVNTPFFAKDKTIIVTGGGSGIGAGLCERFATDGAKAVVVCDINLQGAQRTARKIQSTCPSVTVHARRCDAGSEKEIHELVEFVESTVGPVDMFVANAGISQPRPSDDGIALLESTTEEWHKIIGINVLQAVYAAKHLVPRMVKRGGGNFMVVASAAGLLSQLGNLPYAVTKRSAVSVAEWLSITYGHLGINVTCLCPQGVKTAMTADKDDSIVAVDGMLTVEQVAECCTQALAQGTFLILPHEQVRTYIQMKTSDYDRWIRGMRRMQSRLVSDEAISARL